MAKKGRREHWDRLVTSVEADDGLPTRDSGPWATDKLWYWNRYIEITTKAMADNPRWNGLVYVDLFSGPGICNIRDSRDRIPGSPIIAAKAPKPFRKILLCELEETLADACETRLSRMSPKVDFKVFRGDCNIQIDELVKSIPKRALTLAFLDPTGLHLDFLTIEKLSKNGAVDLLILFPDGVDVLRNEMTYLDQLDSNLDRVLGPDSNWRGRRMSMQTAEPSDLRKLYVLIYREQLKRHLGYEFSDDVTISGPKGPLYRLVYATKSPLGLKFWLESCKKELSGQLDLFK